MSKDQGSRLVFNEPQLTGPPDDPLAVSLHTLRLILERVEDELVPLIGVLAYVELGLVRLALNDVRAARAKLAGILQRVEAT